MLEVPHSGLDNLAWYAGGSFLGIPPPDGKLRLVFFDSPP